MLFWGITLGFIGAALLGMSVVMVHRKITKEKHIDGLVLMSMRHEQFLAIFGIVLMCVGYFLEISAHGLI